MMTNSNEDGVDKVLASRGTYVYIMESGSIDYQVQIRLLVCCLANLFVSGCSELSAHPGWQDLLATQLWPRFGTRSA